MRNYRSHVKLQTEACWLLIRLYDDKPFSANGLASGAALVELVLAAATAHPADTNCAAAVCLALYPLLEHEEWARAAAELGGVLSVLALSAAHADAEWLHSDAMHALCGMVHHSDWDSVQAEAGVILNAAVRGLSTALVAGSILHGICINMLNSLLMKDESIAVQIIATGAFALCIKAMGVDLSKMNCFKAMAVSCFAALSAPPPALRCLQHS